MIVLPVPPPAAMQPAGHSHGEVVQHSDHSHGEVVHTTDDTDHGQGLNGWTQDDVRNWLQTLGLEDKEMQ